jgi:hypothetical protein
VIRERKLTYPGPCLRKLADAVFNPAIKSCPFPAVTECDKIFFSFYEQPFTLVTQRFYIIKPRSKTAIVTLARSLEGIELSHFDHDFVIIDEFLADSTQQCRPFAASQAFTLRSLEVM